LLPEPNLVGSVVFVPVELQIKVIKEGVGDGKVLAEQLVNFNQTLLVVDEVIQVTLNSRPPRVLGEGTIHPTTDKGSRQWWGLWSFLYTRKGVRMSLKDPEVALDDAIGDVVKKGDPGAIVTGWMLSISVKHPTIPQGDGYISMNSEALPYHSQIGLLHAALEEKSNQILLNTFLEAGRG
jgi:hypothetical protein